MFLLTYTTFDLIVLVAVLWRFISLCEFGFFYAIHADWYNTILMALILVHSPAVIY